MKSLYITLWPEERLRDTVGEIKTVDWSDCEEDPREEVTGQEGSGIDRKDSQRNARPR